MRLSLKTLLLELLFEAAFGKQFLIQIRKNGTSIKYPGIATANTKPDERPYRITWFFPSPNDPDLLTNRHVDLTYEEMMEIMKLRYFPKDIVNRIKERYPDSEQLKCIGDEYFIF